jgi:hypothetical protein
LIIEVVGKGGAMIKGKEEIKAAIGVHGMWKARLKKAIEKGASEFSPDIVARDDRCDFGQWLAGAQMELRISSYYQRCKELHRRFHIAAADVLSLAMNGRKDEAKQALETGDFYTLSSSLMRLMVEWNRSIPK